MQDLLQLSVQIGADITGLRTGLGQAQQSVDQFTSDTTQASSTASQAVTASGLAIAASVSASVGIAIGAITSLTIEAQKTQNQLQASLGLSTQEAKRLGDIALDVFRNNIGTSLTDVSNSLQLVRSQMKGLSDEELKSATENAIRLRDVFGTDLASSVKAAKTLMSEFGITQEQAYDFIAKGMQSGLDASGDFLDTIGEYSNQFADMKLSSSEFFSTLETGLKGGMLGTDKIADSFKEFGIRIIDGSKTTTKALSDLGLSAKTLSDDLANGEITKGDAFKLIQEKLAGVDDQVKQNSIGVGLFGTQWEDLGGKAILSVDLQKSGLADLEGSTESLDVVYNDLGTALIGVGRQALVAIMPIGDAILSLVNTAMPYISALAGAVGEIGERFNSLPGPIKDTITAVALMTAAVATGLTVWSAISPMFAGIGASLTAAKATVLGFAATVRTAGLSIGSSIGAAMWPITLAVAAVAGLYLAYRTNFLGIRDFLKPIIANITAIVGKVVDSVRYVIYNSATLWQSFLKAVQITSNTLGGIIKGIGTILSGVGYIIYAAFIQPFVPVFQALQVAGSNILAGLGRLVTSISNLLKPVFSILKAMGIGIGEALQSALNSVGGFVNNLFGNAAGQLQAQANAAAKNNSGFGKGLDTVAAGWNDVTASVNNAGAAYRNLAASTQAAMKTPPPVQVKNAALPASPVAPKPVAVPRPANTAANPYLNTLANSSADPAPVKPAKSTTAKPKAATITASTKDANYKATTADVSALSKEITRLIEDQKRLVKAGKLSEDQAISYKRKVEDLAGKIDKLNLENNKQVTGLYANAKSYVATSNAAAIAAAKKIATTNATAEAERKAAEAKRKQDADAAKAAQDKKRAEQEAEAARKKAEQDAANRTKNISTGITTLSRLVQDQKKLVASGKVSEDQAVAYKRKVEDLTKSLTAQGITTNTNIKDLLKQATAYVGTTNAAAAAATARATADAKEKQAKQELDAQVGKLKTSVKDMSNEELSGTIDRLKARNAYGDAQKLTILNAEAEIRATKQQEERLAELSKALEEYVEVYGSTQEAIKGYNDTTSDALAETAKTNLEARMEAELEAVEDNEAAKVGIKAKYAPQFLQLEIDVINRESAAKLSALEDDYATQLEQAETVGLDTTALTAAYLASRAALTVSTEATITATRLKSARDVAAEQKAIDKDVIEYRKQINKEAAQSLVNGATESLDTSSLSSLLRAKDTLQALIPVITGLDSEALLDLGNAISGIVKNIQDSKDSASSGVKEVIDSTSELATEFDKLGQTLSPKDEYVQDGLAAYDNLIDKYDAALARLKQLREVFEATNDSAGLALVDGITTNINASKTGVVAARDTQATKLGTDFDKVKADEVAKYTIELAIKEKQLVADVSSFKLNSLETEKNAKLALAKTDEEKKQIELTYIERIKTAKLQAIADTEAAALAALDAEREAELAKEGLTQAQIDIVKAFYATRKQLVQDGYQAERDEIDKNANAAEKSNKKLLSNWKDLLKQFVKDMAEAVGTAYATIYNNNKKLAEGNYATPEEKAQAEKDTDKANADASKNAGTALFSSAVNILSTIFPQFAWLIEMVGGLLAKMPQLGIIFQRLGEIFLLGFSLLEPVISLLATVLEPILNIMKVMLEAIIKPLLPILTFFVKVVGGIITAIYGIVKTVWNAIANFLNGINLFGWKPFNLSMLPELNTDMPGTPAVNTPLPPATGSTSPTTETSTGQGSVTYNNKTEVVINVTGGADPQEVARLVEKRLIKSLA